MVCILYFYSASMDSFTHIALGACIGEALLGKKLGKKAMIWGALAQSIPDIDFVTSFWMDTASNLLAHRGFTHSILFGLIAAPLMALLAERWHRPHNIPINRYLLFFFIEIFLHLFLDTFNSYGTGLLEPFSHQRFSFNILFVADPLFSIPIGLAALMLVVLKTKSDKRKNWWRVGIAISCLYLMVSCVNKWIINNATRRNLEAQNLPQNRYFTTPTALNNLLWFVVTASDSGFYIGHKSVFDRHNTTFHYVAKHKHLLDKVDNHEELQKLIRFSQGYYTVENWNDTLVFNDLRFGQIAGWQNPEGKFVFHYFLQDTADNDLVVQRGRFAGWDKGFVQSMLKRIAGN